MTAQNRELSRENFDSFVEGEIYAQLKKLIDDPNTENVLGGLTAIGTSTLHDALSLPSKVYLRESVNVAQSILLCCFVPSDSCFTI